MLLDIVREAAEEVHRAEAELEAARAKLAEAIRLAYREGVSYARIAREAGLSPERVRQIVKSAP